MSSGKKILLDGILVIFVAVAAVFLGCYHKPLSLNDQDTLDNVLEMVVSDMTDATMSNFRLETAIFSDYCDTLLLKYPDKFKDIGDIIDNTRAVIFDFHIDSINVITCATVFEVEYKFLKESVGQKLFTVKDIVEVKD
jgi:hypothetical protein